MSSPFGNVGVNLQPLWAVLPTIAGNFAPFPSVGGSESSDEVGYGEGGYGEGGYDAPGITKLSIPQPFWTVETTK